MLEGELLEYFIGRNQKWRIIRFLIKNPKSSTGTIQSALRLNYGNTSSYLRSLQEKGLVVYSKNHATSNEKPAEKLWDATVDEIVFSFIKKKRLDWYFIIIFYSLFLGFACLVFGQHVAMMVSFINMAIVLGLRLKEAREIK